MTAELNPPPSRAGWKVFIPIVVILIAVFVGLSAIRMSVQKSGNSPDQTLRIDSIAPDLTLKPYSTDSKPKPIKLSDLRFKVILINFWATWCEACVTEMPSIRELYNSYKDKGLEVAAINVDENPGSVVQGSIQKLGINFPVYTDEDAEAAELFHVLAIPLSVVMDHNRKVLFLENGGRDWNSKEVREKVEEWLTK